MWVGSQAGKERFSIFIGTPCCFKLENKDSKGL